LLDAKDGPAPAFLPTVYTDRVSGINANFMRQSLIKNKIDPDGPPVPVEDMSDPNTAKAWRDIWSAGHGVVNITDIPSVETLVNRLEKEYKQAKTRDSHL